VSRTAAARRLAYLLEERLGRHVDVAWDPSRKVWSVEWADGPGVDEMHALVLELAGELGREAAALVEGLRYDRSAGGRMAWAVQLVRHVAAGGELLPVEPYDRSHVPPGRDAMLRFTWDRVEQPWADRPTDAEERRLAEALIRAASDKWGRLDEDAAWELLRVHGLGVLTGETLPPGVVRLRRPDRAETGPLSAP
jgi:hypothetical protein